MKAIVLGCGRQGSLLATLLEKEGVEVTVIDISSRSLTRLEKFKGKKILGDGMKQEILEKAGVKDVNAFAAVTNSDNINLIAAQIARGIFQVPRVVCRVHDPNRAVVYSDLGLDTVNYSRTGTQLLKNYITHPEIYRKEPLGDGCAITIEFQIAKEFAGKPVSSVNLARAFHCSAIIRGVKVIIADSDIQILEGDRAFGVALEDKVNQIVSKFGVKTLKEIEIKDEDIQKGE